MLGSGGSETQTQDSARLSRLYHALRRTNRALLRERDRDELLRQVCRAAVEDGGFLLAWVGRHDPATGSIDVLTQCGDETGYLRSLNIRVDGPLEADGPAARAFKTGRPYVANDFLTDPSARPWFEAARRRGIRAAAVFPVSFHQQPWGLLCLYGAEAGYFRSEELALLDEMAADISFGLENFHLEGVRRQADEIGRHFAAIVESTNDAILSKSPTGRITSWNSAAERMFGYRAEEIIGRDILTLIPADRVTEEPEILARIAKGQRIVDFETVRVRKNGVYFPVSVTISPIKSADGVVTGASKIVRDLSDRRRAESALQEAELQFKTIVEQLGEGLLIYDMDRNLLASNAAAKTILGFTADEAFPGTPQEFLALLELSDLDGTLLPPGQGPVSRIARGEELRDVEFRVRRRGRAWERTLSYSGSQVQRLGGRPLLFAIFRDVTEQHRAAQALREANAELEGRVLARTAELAIAKERAEEADRLKSSFLATMSHELRTPLNSIIGFTSIVLQQMAGPLNEEQTKQLGMVRQSARHLLALINDVLDISKIEAGQMRIQRAIFDVDETIRRVVSSIEPLAARKGLAVRIDCPGRIGEIRSDARRVEQVLLNLLGNAVKFTDHGEICLAVNRSAHLPPTLVFRITDTGIGIDAQELKHLFQSFRQLDSGLTRQHEGTGLGLSISQHLAGLLGGSLVASSTPGIGSEFTFSLPLDTGEFA
jgi:PAS domain S-box-containing protein